jgi:quinoprotein glucose dehydrogenase
MVREQKPGRQIGTPYVMKRDYIFKVDNGQLIPQSKPPWGTILAIDVNNDQKNGRSH